MPRRHRIARAARRAHMMLNGEFYLLEDEDVDFTRPPTCPYCDRALCTPTDRARHIMARPECRSQHMSVLIGKRRQRLEREYQTAGPSSNPHPKARRPKHATQPPSGAEPRYNDPRCWDDHGRSCRTPYVEEFPVSTAGKPVSRHRTHPKDLGAYLESCGNLANPSYMEAAELLMTSGLSAKARTRHLQSSFYKGKTPWRDNRTLLVDVNKLPHGPEWVAQEFVVGKGSYERSHILYKRSVLDVIRELIGNPRFKDAMRYAPERHWTSSTQTSRVYGEMWTGNWWWRRQTFLKDQNGTIVPVILASDKTTMTKLSGNQSAYPVYLTIGNISKSVRQKTSTHALSIVGYLPVDDFKDVPSRVLRTQLKGELLHNSMRSIMEPLEEAGRSGENMWCADGQLRRAYPLLAAFIGDWPEQNDMACTSRSGCPKCLKKYKGRGDAREAAPRTRLSTLKALKRYRRSRKKRTISELGLKPWWPWWANLPGVEFGKCITPDLLHQLHKGLFKSHAMKWVQEKVGETNVDERFASMTRAHGLRHFKRGVSVVQQWTGRETKEMEKVFLPLLAEHQSIDEDLEGMIRALLDFSYLARASRLTDVELGEMQGALAEMHRLKDVLVRSGIYQGLGRFDKIAKWHMVTHYPASIKELGTPDGYNTEAPEYSHIVYVKRGWAASNKRDAIPQIIEFCQRLEALRIHRAYLDEYYGEGQGAGEAPTTAILVDTEDDVEFGGLGDENEDEWEDMEDNQDDAGIEGNDGDGEEARRPTMMEIREIEYPQPEYGLAIRPTKRVMWNDLVVSYGATSLETALRSFLRPYTQGRFFFLPHDSFDVWHKLTLYHLPLSFAPDEPSQRDVIRVRPPIYDGHGRLRRPGVFDTALYLHSPEKFGLHRYHAGRVRSIFRLPDRLQYIYPDELVYLELFTNFNHALSPTHQLHTTSHARNSGARHCVVVPISDLALACHLAPRFRRIDSEIRLDTHSDLLSEGTRFFFNHYYNHYTWQLVQYWRHHQLISE